MRNTYLDTLHQIAPKLSHKLAVALSTECAMRAYIAWEYIEEPSDDLYHALELAWLFACTGTLKSEYQQTYDKLLDLIQEYRENPDSEYHILLSIISVFELILTPTMQEKCVIESLTAVIDTANCVDRDNQKEAEDEEIKFQLLLLEKANSYQGNIITRDIFNRLGDNESGWVNRILAGE